MSIILKKIRHLYMDIKKMITLNSSVVIKE